MPMTESDAYALVRSVGRTVTLRERAAVVGTASDTDITAAVRDVKDAAVDGVTVQRGDRLYLIPAASVSEAVKPNGDWSIVESSVERGVIAVRQHTGNNGAVVAYDCLARI